MKKALYVCASVLVMTLTATPVTAAEMQIYVVANVATGNVLNLRSGPGVSNTVVARIPADGQGVVATGEEKKVGSSTWVRVYWNGKGGWVNKNYLKPDSGATGGSTGTTPTPRPPATGPVMRCGGTEPFWSIDITETRLSVDMADGPKYGVPVTFRQTSANNRTIAVIAGANGPQSTQLFLQKVQVCSDGMSDTKYPYTATAVLNNKQVISGCCRVQ